MFRKYAANTETVNMERQFISGYGGYVPRWRNKKQIHKKSVWLKFLNGNLYRVIGDTFLGDEIKSNYIKNQFDWSFWTAIYIGL